MKVSFVATVFNEEKNIQKFLKSLFLQEQKPFETIIVDGGSSDKTVELIKKFSKDNSFKILVLVKKGNRSVGRNEGIRNAKGDVIAVSDAGNILERSWLKKIIEPFKKKDTQVVAGFYKGEAKNIFQKSLIPYVLVMSDRVDKNNFLPATRSMAFKKSVWEKIGKFNEKYSHNEDYVFAKIIEEKEINIHFVREAVVKWIPRNTLKEAFVMFFRFALGDAEAKIFRPKVFFIFYRYFLFGYLFLLNILLNSLPLNIFLLTLFCVYIFWAIFKNYKYIKNHKAFFYLPLLQLTSDVAVMSGSILGFFKSLKINPLNLIKKNRFFIIVLLFYIGVQVLLLPTGTPNRNHPFTYFMDEWHQLQAVRNVLRFGTPNIPGSANGSIFQFLLAGIYLIPFQVLGIINLFSIRSSVLDLQMQKTLFEVLRINTLLFGLGSATIFAYIGKKFFNLNSGISAFIFVFNPVFIIISNYFKYDIALLFWILFTILFLLRYSRKPSLTNYLIVGFISGIALSVKVSAIPLLPIYLFIYLLLTPPNKKSFKVILTGLLVFVFTFLLVGIPDVLFGMGNLNEYLMSVITQTPNITSYNYNLGMNYPSYLFLRLFPITFGHAFYYLFLTAVVFLLIMFKKVKIFKQKEFLVLMIYFFFFALSLIPLKIEARGNRLIVLLPFMVLLSVLFLKQLYFSIKINMKKYIFIALAILLVVIQLAETYSWIAVKIGKDPRVNASSWIIKNIPSSSLIGVENIPLYQMLPDIVVKEFYLKQYNKSNNNSYKYSIINSRSKEVPKFVVISNDEIEERHTKNSDKKKLVQRLERENYNIRAQFRPDFSYLNYFSSELDFYMSGLIFTPNTVSVFEKR